MGRPFKYFVDKEKKVKECAKCHVIKPFALFSPISKKYGTRHAVCTPCRSPGEAVGNVMRAAHKNPHRYYECPMCWHLWSKMQGTICKKCKSVGGNCI